jgi:hypothetical protein
MSIQDESVRWLSCALFAAVAIQGCAADTDAEGDNADTTSDDLQSWGHIGTRILYCSPKIVNAANACDGLKECIIIAFKDGLYSSEVLTCLAQETAGGGTVNCVNAAKEATACLRDLPKSVGERLDRPESTRGKGFGRPSTPKQP